MSQDQLREELRDANSYIARLQSDLREINSLVLELRNDPPAARQHFPSCVSLYLFLPILLRSPPNPDINPGTSNPAPQKPRSPSQRTQL